jgi:hypothetical protein
LIERSGQAPPLVLVEINVLHEPVETQMLDSLLVPGLRQLRGRFSVLRETSSPHHVALRALRQVAGPRAAGTDATVRADLGRTLLERRLRELAAPLEPDELERIAEALGGHVAALQARGVTVGFYEVPEHPDAMEAARPSSVRKRVQEEFPPDRYFWVPAQDPRQYETTDAIHLSRTSATRYCQVLAEAAETAQGVTSHPAASEPAPP